ncbi:cytochrome P450, partial [Trichodelitschia bisporula]
RRNIGLARTTGLPYVISPLYPFSRIWIATEKIWTPIVSLLPESITNPWLPLLDSNSPWRLRHLPFASLKSDTYLVVAPFKITLFTCDPDVIAQVTTRRVEFPKPTELYELLQIYGSNIVTVEGSAWRRHRRIVAPPFSEKNNALVWSESLFQAREMVRTWVDGGRSESVAIPSLSKDVMRFSLHVISRAGFGVRCLWPGGEAGGDEGGFDSSAVPEGHAMSYQDSLETLLKRIIVVLVVPMWLQRYLPFKTTSEPRIAYEEWGKYMRTIYAEKTASIQSSTSDDAGGLDLMGSMIRASTTTPPSDDKSGSPPAGLTPDEIIGNSFIMFLAGHETTANTLHYALIHLALRPDVQSALHAAIAALPPNPTYDTYPVFAASWPGAVIAETLRIYPPVIGIPKSAPQAATLTIDGRDVLIPAGATLSLNAVAAHRNPAAWPHGPARSEGEGGEVHPASPETDLEEWKPERWFIEGREGELFSPPKGAYIAFSEGQRSCIGRRFALVELVAALVALLRDYEVELETGVAEGAGEEEKAAAWEKARLEAERALREDVGPVFTLQFRGGTGVALRVVKRG